VRLAELPRMADFACFGEAVGRGLGWAEGAFVSAYSDNRGETGMTALEESLVATALLDCACLGGLLNWTLSATEMLEQLGDDIPVKMRASARWPKSPMAFTNELRRIAPLFRTRGISVKFTRTRDNRLITINADRSVD
jgi:putative DNA primase/helicase